MAMKKEYNLTAVQEYITNDVEPQWLCKALDDAMFNIARSHVHQKGDDILVGDVDLQLYCLRDLRNLFSAMD